MCVAVRPYIRGLTCSNQSAIAAGDFFIPAFQCPHRVERVGTLGDGGKWVCGLDRVAKQDKCVIYSFGLLHSPLPLHHPLPFAAIPRSGLTSNLFSYVPGVNHESSFESTLLTRAPSCDIWGYDYSVNSVRSLPSPYLLLASLDMLTPDFCPVGTRDNSRSGTEETGSFSPLRARPDRRAQRE